MKTTIIILLTILTLTRCETRPNVKEQKFDFTCKDSIHKDSIEYIVFGTYCGMCEGNYTDMFRLENQTLCEDTSDSFYFKDHSHSFNIALSDKKYNEALELKKIIPCYFYNKETHTFGTPDSYDQGGVYLEFKYNKKIKIYHMDSYVKNNPVEVQLFAQQIKDLVADMNEKE